MALRTWIGGNADFSATAGWLGGTRPGANDDVLMLASGTNITAGLTYFNGVTFTSISFPAEFTDSLGTSAASAEINATTFNIGQSTTGSTSAGSPNLYINAGTVQTTLNVALATNLVFTNTHASSVANITAGNVYISNASGVTGQLATLNVRGGAVVTGSGLTLATLVVDEGTVIVNGALTTLTIRGGTVTTQGTGTLGTVTVYRGNLYGNSSGTITSLTVETGGNVNFAGDMRAKTISTLVPKPGANIVLDNGTKNITITNAIDPGNASISDMTWSFNPGMKITIT